MAVVAILSVRTTLLAVEERARLAGLHVVVLRALGRPFEAEKGGVGWEFQL